MPTQLVPTAIRDLAEEWEGVHLGLEDFLFAGCVRDAIKQDVGERGTDLWTVSGDKQNLMGALGEHLTRVHLLRQSARQHDSVLAEEQTRCLLMVHNDVRDYIITCESAGRDWGDDLHKFMEERPGPAPAKTATDRVDNHVCTDLPCVKYALNIIRSNIDDLHCYFGDSLSKFLREAFDSQEEAVEYIKELIVISVYIGPVAQHEAIDPKWAFQLKGRAVQYSHARFGKDDIATSDRYLVF